MRRTLAAVFLVAVLPLVSAGCGGGSDEAPPAAGAPQPPEANAGAAEPAGSGQRPGAQLPQLPPIEELQAAVERDPSDYRMRHLLAMALHRAGRREEALVQFEKTAEQSPEPIYLIELGVAYASLQRMEESEATFKRALEIAPDNPIVLYHLGNLTQRRGDTDEAISLYRQAIQNDPDYLLAHFQLGESLRHAGKLKEAYRSYERVVSLDPKSPPELDAFDSALLQLASLDLQMGATERAVQFLQVLVEANPDHPTAHLLLGQALSKLGRQDEAKEQLAIHQRIATRQPPGS